MDGLSLIFINLQKNKKAIEVYDQMLKIFPHNLSNYYKTRSYFKLIVSININKI